MSPINNNTIPHVILLNSLSILSICFDLSEFFGKVYTSGHMQYLNNPKHRCQASRTR
jgi:carboxypeptidase C (cathepsin A)